MKTVFSAVVSLCCLVAIMFTGAIHPTLAQVEPNCVGPYCDATNTVEVTPSRPPQRVSAEPSAYSGVRELCLSLCIPLCGFLLAGLWQLIGVLASFVKPQKQRQRDAAPSA